MKRVHVEPRRLLRKAIDVEIDDDGNVTLDGEAIGEVRKGHRTYSPPIHRGSPVARYHRRVPCWFASGTRLTFDTRADALAHLAVEARR